METLHSEGTAITQIYDLLYRLGVTANYTGFFHAAYAVLLAAQDPQRLLLITKWLYPDVARHYGTTRNATERNIRTVVSMAWEKNPGLLSELAGLPLTEKPRNGQFIAILAAHFSQERSA